MIVLGVLHRTLKASKEKLDSTRDIKSVLPHLSKFKNNGVGLEGARVYPEDVPFTSSKEEKLKNGFKRFFYAVQNHCQRKNINFVNLEDEPHEIAFIITFFLLAGAQKSFKSKGEEEVNWRKLMDDFSLPKNPNVRKIDFDTLVQRLNEKYPKLNKSHLDDLVTAVNYDRSLHLKEKAEELGLDGIITGLPHAMHLKDSKHEIRVVSGDEKESEKQQEVYDNGKTLSDRTTHEKLSKEIHDLRKIARLVSKK